MNANEASSTHLADGSNLSVGVLCPKIKKALESNYRHVMLVRSKTVAARLWIKDESFHHG